jgi:hypothetical protein
MPKAQFHKGDLVTFRLTTRVMRGEVKEDRGPIGVNGRHLYLVEFSLDPDSTAPSQIELPAEELQAARDAATKK